MWVPLLNAFNQPVYLSIADALARDIASGLLKPGERLPTLRELAQALQVTPGTVNRAYGEAQRRGLLQGEVGRGTYVRATPLVEVVAEPEPQVLPSPLAVAPQVLDLSIIKPAGDTASTWLRGALVELANGTDFAQALDYAPDGGHPAHREAGAQWLRHSLPEAVWQQVVITAGAQHGRLVAISALTESDDLILCESLCYPGIISLAHSLQRRLRGVEMDEEGIIPASLREVCQRERPAMLVCVATCQNPTTATMSHQRRAEIAAIAEEFDFLILDDDIYGFLATDTTLRPLASYAPERSVYLTSLSKSVLPALRIGYLYAPARLLSRLTAMVRSSVWMPSPLTAQLASNIIHEGLDQRLVKLQREEAARRQAMARERMPGLAQGVKVLSGSQFQAERSGVSRGVRVVLMSPTREDELRFALTQLASLVGVGDPRRFY